MDIEELVENFKTLSKLYINPLIIESVKMMGDLLHTGIIIRHFRTIDKNRNILWAISEKYLDTLKYFPYATKLIGMPHELSLENRQNLLKQLRNNFGKYNVLSGCPGVSGWNIAGSIADQFFHNVGIKKLVIPRRPILPLSVEDHAWAVEFMKTHNLKRFATMEYNSFSFERKKKGGIWPLACYEELLENIKGPIVWLAHNDAPSFKSGIDGRQTTFRQAAALIKLSSIFLGSGSGLTMVAATEGMNTPIYELGIGRTITMRGCGYKDSISINESPKEVAKLVNDYLK